VSLVAIISMVVAVLMMIMAMTVSMMGMPTHSKHPEKIYT